MITAALVAAVGAEFKRFAVHFAAQRQRLATDFAVFYISLRFDTHVDQYADALATIRAIKKRFLLIKHSAAAAELCVPQVLADEDWISRENSCTAKEIPAWRL